ncbi:MAG: oligosaccharide flippase family protein [Syntrophobacteraceae bacterium]|nr:oligosaccharide flippase family protein [Desulfobacteraceae bacterium]
MNPAGSESHGHPAGRYAYNIFGKCFYLFGAHWFREALQTLFFVYLARKASSTYGEFILGLSAGQILLFLTEFGLNQHLIPLLAKNRGNSAGILAQVSSLKGGLLVPGLAGLWLFAGLQHYSPGLRNLFFAFGIGFGMEALASSFFAACQAEGRQDAEGKIRSAAATAGFTFGFTALLMGAAPCLIAAYKIVEASVNLAGSAFFVLRKQRLTFGVRNPGEFWTLWRGSLVFMAMALATTFYNRANLFFLQQHAGPDAVAQYGVSWQLVDGLSALVSNLLLRNVMFPLFAVLWREDRGELARMARNSSSLLFAAALPIMFVLAAESDRIITLVYGPGYSDAIWIQRYLVLVVGIGFLQNLAAYLMIAVNRPVLLLGFYTAGLALNAVSCAWLIPALPLAGAVFSLIATKGFVAILTVGFCQKRIGLFHRGHLAQAVSVLAAGAAFYVAGLHCLPREIAELAALVPALFLGWKWWREFSHAAPARAGAAG